MPVACPLCREMVDEAEEYCPNCGTNMPAPAAATLPPPPPPEPAPVIEEAIAIPLPPPALTPPAEEAAPPPPPAPPKIEEEQAKEAAAAPPAGACPTCGSSNPPGSAFCETCGEPLGALAAAPPPPAPVPAPAPPPAAIPSAPAAGGCPSCGSTNPAGAVYCENCGERLALALPEQSPQPGLPAPPPATPAAAAQPAGACPLCGASNEPGAVYCENCGAPLTHPPAAPAYGQAQRLPQQAASPVIHLPAPAPLAEKMCPRCGDANAPDARFCDNCGERLELAAAAPSPAPAPPAPLSLPPARAPAPPAAALPLQPAALVAGACPSCGAQNVPGEVYCGNCGMKLTEAAAPSPAPQAAPAEVEATFVGPPPPLPKAVPVAGVCPSCGAKNVAGELYCNNCGVQLPPVAVTPPPPPVPVSPGEPAELQDMSTKPKPPVIEAVFGRLIVQNTGASIIIPPGKTEIVIGRTDPIGSIFPDVDTTPHGGEDAGVSRRHARIVAQGEQLLVEDLGSTNFTFLNKQKLAPGQPLPLKDGDVLRLGWLVMVYQAG